MQDHGLGTAGTISAVTGTGATAADMMGWLNVNADGMGVLVGCTMALFTAAFYASSIYLRNKEANAKREVVIEEIRRDFFGKLENHNISQDIRDQAICIVCDLLERRGKDASRN